MARQAITTKFLGPTNTLGSRVKANCQAGSVTVSWDHSHDVEDNHTAAAVALLTKMGWLEWSAIQDWRPGALPDATGYAFVCCK